MDSKTDLYFQIHEYGTFPVGSGATDIGFKFDNADKLKEVYVRTAGVWL